MLVAVGLVSLVTVLPATTAGAVSVAITVPPVDGDNGWHRARPTLTIDASDSAGITWLTYGFVSPGTTRNYASPYPTAVTQTVQPTAPGNLTLNATASSATNTTASGSATLKWDPDAPSVVTNVRWTSTAGLVTESTSSPDESVCGQWNASTDALSGLREYRVQLSETADFALVLADRYEGSATSRSACFGTADGVRYGHSYYFRVLGRDQAGNESQWSAPSNRVSVSDQTVGPALAHAPVLTSFVGQSIPITFTATCDADGPCVGRLYYRVTPITGAANVTNGSWTRLDLTAGPATTLNGRSAIDWSGSIPAAVVTSTGVDYFVEAEDTFALTQFPGGTYVGTTSTHGLQPAAHGFVHVAAVSPPVLAHVTPLFARDHEPVALELDATCSTGSCTATLYYRTTGYDGTLPLVGIPPWPRVAMSQTGTAQPVPGIGAAVRFAAEIPGEVIDTAGGVDYFFAVNDGYTTSYWPGTSYVGHYAPTDGMRTGWHHLHVLETPHVVHTAPATSPYRAPISVEATATCTSGTCSGTLYYRATPLGDPFGNEPQFTTTAMTATTTAGADGVDVVTVSAQIPASVVDTRGIDYFFFVTDGSTRAGWPGTSTVDAYGIDVNGVRVFYHHVHVLEPPHFFHVPVTTAPALEDLTISTQASCVTADCQLTLHYSDSPTATTFRPVPMSRIGPVTSSPAGELTTWTATIPGGDITTRGLAYYLEAFDGHTRSFSPGTPYNGAYLRTDAARAAAHPVRVLEPPHLVHVPVATSYYDQPIPIEAASNCATGACTGRLYWRTSGHAWRNTPMTVSPGGPATALGDTIALAATIPASDVTTEGVDYRLEVNDGYVTDSSATYHTTVLAPTAILHAPVLTAQRNTPLTVEAAVPCATLSCTVDLFWRIPGDSLLAEPAWEQMSMPGTGLSVPVGEATTVRVHRATIPADGVTTEGVEYYIRARDGFTTAYSPGTAYIATQSSRVDGLRTHYFSVHVLEPVHVAHVPVLVAQAGDPVPIRATATCATDTCTATVGYRRTPALGTVDQIVAYATGGPAFTEVTMAATVIADTPAGRVLDLAAVIPAATATASGLDYWIRVHDGATTAYLPGTSYLSPAGSTNGTRVMWWHTTIATTRTTGSIGDLVWVDRDGDATRDSFEPGLPGVRLLLAAAGPDGQPGTGDDIALGDTRSDTTGAYVFTGLPDGAYRVTVDPASLPAGITAPGPGSQDVTITAAAARLDIDFGYRYPETGVIEVTVWHDIDADNTLDAGEAPIGGASATLTWNGYDDVPATGDERTWGPSTTSTAGTTQFDNLPDGIFTVTLDPATIPYGTELISGSNPTTLQLPPLATRSVRTGYRYTGHIDVTVWDDIDDDDTIDPTEERISGATVVIHRPGPDGLLRTPDDVVEATKTTGADGQALFPYLAPGVRRVVVAGRLDIDWDVTP